jgi:hypothetical protein
VSIDGGDLEKLSNQELGKRSPVTKLLKPIGNILSAKAEKNYYAILDENPMAA